MKHLLLSIAASMSVLLVIGCGENSTHQTTVITSMELGAESPLSAVLVSTAPVNPMTITALKKQKEPGKTVVLKGRVGGPKPFIDDIATMVVVDTTAIAACDAIPGDMCSTPWDFCCAGSENIAAASSLVRVLDSEGKLIRTGLSGLDGIEAGSFVIVEGIITDNSTNENLIINATGIFHDRDREVEIFVKKGFDD